MTIQEVSPERSSSTQQQQQNTTTSKFHWPTFGSPVFSEPPFGLCVTLDWNMGATDAHKSSRTMITKKESSLSTVTMDTELVSEAEEQEEKQQQARTGGGGSGMMIEWVSNMQEKARDMACGPTTSEEQQKRDKERVRRSIRERVSEILTVYVDTTPMERNWSMRSAE